MENEKIVFKTIVFSKKLFFLNSRFYKTRRFFYDRLTSYMMTLNKDACIKKKKNDRFYKFCRFINDH